jgi:exodeoxyribonuclease-3
MKVLSWNINGLHSWKNKKEVFQFLAEENFDIISLQELRTSQAKIMEDDILNDFPFHFYHLAEKNGYSGTAIFTKQKPLNYQFGLEEINQEGRVITLEFSDFFLVNVYTPNSKIDLSRLEYRQKVWDVAFLKHLKKLIEQKEVIVNGDLNVLGSDLDLQHYEFYRDDFNFQKKILVERNGFQNILNLGLVDTFRFLHPEKAQFSWIAPPKLRFPCTRLDYFLISENWLPKVISSIIQSCVGSDHLPIILKMEKDFQSSKSDLVDKIFFPEVHQPTLF